MRGVRLPPPDKAVVSPEYYFNSLTVELYKNVNRMFRNTTEKKKYLRQAHDKCIRNWYHDLRACCLQPFHVACFELNGPGPPLRGKNINAWPLYYPLCPARNLKMTQNQSIHCLDIFKYASWLANKKGGMQFETQFCRANKFWRVQRWSIFWPVQLLNLWSALFSHCHASTRPGVPDDIPPPPSHARIYKPTLPPPLLGP